MGSAVQCPYPTCEGGDQFQDNRTCGCAYRQPVVACLRCGAANRVGARFCRACRGEIDAVEALQGASLDAGAASTLQMTGSFRRPPIVADGFLYALSKEGLLVQLSSRAGAHARQVARFDLASAGFNQGALIDVGGGSNNLDGRGRLQGSTFLAVGPAGVVGLSLASGGMTTLYEASASEGEEVAANRSEADATNFKGLVANGKFVAFVVRNAAGENKLTIQYLAEDRPREQPMMLEGTQVAGPVLCRQRLAFCTERQVGLYDCETQAAFVAAFPDGFEPLLSPVSEDLTIAPGGMPLAIEQTSEGGSAVHVAGVMQERVGLLRVDFRQKEASYAHALKLATFRLLPRGSSLRTNRDGSMCLNLLDAVEVFGAAEAVRAEARMQPGMPASYEVPYLCWFGEVDLAGQHRLQMMKGGQRVELRFEDSACNRETCCGVYVLGGDVVVAYLDVDAGEEAAGLRFWRWSVGG